MKFWFVLSLFLSQLSIVSLATDSKDEEFEQVARAKRAVLNKLPQFCRLQVIRHKIATNVFAPTWVNQLGEVFEFNDRVLIQTIKLEHYSALVEFTHNESGYPPNRFKITLNDKDKPGVSAKTEGTILAPLVLEFWGVPDEYARIKCQSDRFANDW